MLCTTWALGGLLWLVKSTIDKFETLQQQGKWFLTNNQKHHFLSVYFSSIDPQKFIDGYSSSPGCSVINESPGLFKFWADPVKP